MVLIFLVSQTQNLVVFIPCPMSFAHIQAVLREQVAHISAHCASKAPCALYLRLCFKDFCIVNSLEERNSFSL